MASAGNHDGAKGLRIMQILAHSSCIPMEQVMQKNLCQDTFFLICKANFNMTPNVN